jgi:5'-nucleotidase
LFACSATCGHLCRVVLGDVNPERDGLRSGTAVDRALGGEVGSVLEPALAREDLTLRMVSRESTSGRSALAVSLDVLTPVAASASSGGAAIASLDAVDDEKRNWATAADLAVTLLSQLSRAPAGTVLNLNVPDVPADQLAGLRRGSLASFGQVQVAIAEAGEGFVRTAVEATGARSEPGTDLALLTDGYASVTPIRSVGEDPEIVLDDARADA